MICGAISQYNATAPVQGPANYLSLLVNRARMEGMVFDYADRYPQAIAELAGYLKSGLLEEPRRRRRRARHLPRDAASFSTERTSASSCPGGD